MLTVTVALVTVGGGVDEGLAGGAAPDEELPPPPPQLASRNAPTMAAPVPEKSDVFMRSFGATAIPDATPLDTTSCVNLDYRVGKAVSKIVAARRRARQFFGFD